MKKFSKAFLSLLTIGCMTPTTLFGATGDIYDIALSMKYTKENNDIFKSNVKDKVSEDHNLYIETEDGNLLNYKSLKNAERSAIVEIMNKYGIDINNKDVFSDAIVKYSDEIEELRAEKISKLEKRNKPATEVSATSDMSNLGKVIYSVGRKEDTGEFLLTIKELQNLKTQPFDGELMLTIKNATTLETIKTQDIEVGSEVTFSTSIPVYLEFESLNGHKLVIHEFSRVENDGEINEDTLMLSDVITGVSGNSSDGYTYSWTFNATVEDGPDRVNYTKPLVIKLVTESGEVLYQQTTLDRSGSVVIPKVSTDRLKTVVETETGDEVYSGGVNLGDYTVDNLVFMEIDTSQSKLTRKQIGVSTLSTPEYTGDSIYVEVTQNDDVVFSDNVPPNGSFTVDLTEGEYTVSIYSNSTKFAKLDEEVINFEWALPNSFIIESKFEEIIYPWDYSHSVDIMLTLWHNDSIVIDEDFDIKLSKVGTSDIIYEGNFNTEYSLKVPTWANGEVKIEVRYPGDEEYTHIGNWVLPMSTQLKMSPFADIKLGDTPDSRALHLYVTPYEGVDMEDMLSKVDMSLVVSNKIDGSPQELFTIPLDNLNNGTTIVPVPEEYLDLNLDSTAKELMVVYVDKSGNRSVTSSEIMNRVGLNDVSNDNIVGDFEADFTLPNTDTSNPLDQTVGFEEDTKPNSTDIDFIDITEIDIPNKDEDDDSLQDLNNDLGGDDDDFDLPVIDFDDL